MLRSGLDASPLEGSSTHFCCARCGLIPFSEVWARLPRLGTPSPGCVTAAGGGCGSGEAPGSSPSAGARRRRADSRAQSAPETLAGGRGGIGGAAEPPSPLPSPDPGGPESRRAGGTTAGRMRMSLPYFVPSSRHAARLSAFLLSLLLCCHSGSLELCSTKEGAVGSVCKSGCLVLLRPHRVWESPSARA